MKAAGMGTMGKRCCCCPDFWVFCEADGTLGWRGLFTSGEYPDNEVRIEREPHNQPFGQRISPDYRNKKFYLGTIKQSDTTKIELVEYDFHFENRRVILEYSRYGNPVPPVLAIDWLNGRLFYSKWILYDEGTSGDEFEQEIRRVDLDGTNDTLVFTKTWTQVAEGQIDGIFQMIYEPINNYLFYAFRHFEEHLKGTPTPVLDANIYTELMRCDADDGSNQTTIVTLADTVNVYGDWLITGLGVFPNTEVLFWIQRHTTSVSSVNYELVTSDLDGGGSSVIWSEEALDGQAYTRCFPCEKDQRIYFEVGEFPPDVGEQHRVLSIEQNGDDLRSEFDDRQGDWNDGDGTGGSMRPGGAIVPRLGCKRELTGEDWAGSGYS